MDKKEDVSPEELATEQEQLAEVKEEEIRASVIEEYGFDETADADRITKMVNKELDNRKKLSTAIGQKRKWRDEAQKFHDEHRKGGTATVVTPNPTSQQLPVEEVVLLDKWTEKGMPDPKALLVYLKKVAQVEGIPLLEAQNHSLFIAEKDRLEKEKKQRDAGLGAGRGAGAPQVKKNPLTPGLSRDEHRKMVMGQ